MTTAVYKPNIFKHRHFVSILKIVEAIVGGGQ